MLPEIRSDLKWFLDLENRLQDEGPWSSLDQYRTGLEAEQHLSVSHFKGLIAPSHLPHLTLLDHQYETARRVIEEMHGKAILADEVGLGKTIEAGLIMKEYMIRGLAKKILVLVPASLVLQWTAELNQKFYIPAVAQRKSYVWEACDVVVSSIDTAKRQPHSDLIKSQDYDLIIIDEAHKLKNPKTKSYEFVNSLKKKFCLLLTATPVQNQLNELFYLVSLLKPGYLGDAASFVQEYKGAGRKVKNDRELRALINQVMVRNRRGETGIEWTKRHVETVQVKPADEERQIHEALQDLKATGLLQGFPLLTLQREACSSREAVYLTLKKMSSETALPLTKEALEEIIQKVSSAPPFAKTEKVLELIKAIDDKVIIFTEYRATQLFLQWFLQQHGISSVPYRGGFKRSKKDWMRQLFQNHAQVLIATEAGGEGINLQFCSHIINYDLPWNPMRLEQRIGRVHRFGQKSDVKIYNMATENTVESHILQLLYEKINLFEMAVGELDQILEKLEIKELHTSLQMIMEESESDGEMKIKMDNLARVIQAEHNEWKEDEHEAGGNLSLS